MARAPGTRQRLLGPALWPVAPPLLGLLAGLVVVVVVDWRPGLLIFGASVGLAALLRLVLPQRAAGLLVVRARGFDVVVLTVLAAAIIAVALLR